MTREALSKKYFRAARIGCGTCSHSDTRSDVFTGLLSIIGNYSVKKSTSTAEKQEKIKTIASAKLNTISSHISKALSDKGFQLILEELEKYKVMKEEVTSKKKISTETEESLIEQGRREVRESFWRLVKKEQYRGLGLELQNINAVFPALLVTNKIVLKITIVIALKSAFETMLQIM